MCVRTAVQTITIASVGLGFVLIGMLASGRTAPLEAQVSSVGVGNEGLCHAIRAGGAGTPGFGTPYSNFSGNLLVRMWCGGDQVAVTIGDAASSTYVYRSGYVFESGTWRKVEFAGYPMTGDWFVGSAYARVPAAEESAYFLSYSCERVRGNWRCGCADATCARSMWQLQMYGDRYLSLHNPDSQEMYLETATTYDVVPGEKLGLSGHHFGLSGNDVYFDDIRVARAVPSANRTTLEFTIPKLEPKKYRVQVRNGTRASKDVLYVWALSPNAQVPRIVSVSPNRISPGDTVKIAGSGFSRDANDVVTSFGTIANVPSPSGNEITFVYEPFGSNVRFVDAQGNPTPLSVETGFMVANTHGFSNQVFATVTH